MAKTTDYQKLNEELEDLLSKLEAGEGDVDQAIKQYQRGMEIVKELESYLKSAENKVKKIKAEWA